VDTGGNLYWSDPEDLSSLGGWPRRGLLEILIIIERLRGLSCRRLFKSAAPPCSSPTVLKISPDIYEHILVRNAFC
jgi:hypothetical protein